MGEPGPSLFLGVDRGNTTTVAIVFQPDGETVGAGRARHSDIDNAPDEANRVALAVDALRLRVDPAVAECRLQQCVEAHCLLP